MIIKNILTNEERLQIPRLIEHDCINESHLISCILEQLDDGGKWKDYSSELHAKLNHISQTQKIVHILSQNEGLIPEHLVGRDLEKHFLRDLKNLFGNKVKINVEPEFIASGIYTERGILHSVLYKLIKNAEAARKGKQGLIEVSERKFSGFPEHALYIPESAENYKEFVVFEVYDNGRGFPRDFPYLEKFTKAPPKGEGGFGFYFTGLAAKVLGGCVDIQSQPGDTRVSFFHPIYSE